MAFRRRQTLADRYERAGLDLPDLRLRVRAVQEGGEVVWLGGSEEDLREFAG